MSIVVIAHNIRSTHNVGSIFRTCEGFGVDKLYLTGYTPYPSIPNDPRLPHIHEKLTTQIHKTALGAENMVSFEHYEDMRPLIEKLKEQGYEIVGLEQDATSIPLPDYRRKKDTALILGEEVSGITSEYRAKCDTLLEIPMHGKKESFNVSVATGIALYALNVN